MEHNIYVFVAIKESNCLSKNVTESAAQVITFNSEDEILSAAKNLQIDNKNTRVFCASEDYLISAAKIRESLHIPGLTLEITQNFRDKTVMKKRLEEATLRVPKFGHFDRSMSFETVKNEVGTPFILKLVDALGALGVHTIHNEQGYINAVENMINDRYQYEGFITGKLYHVDTLMQSGETVFQVACEYTAPNLEFQKGKAIISLPMPATDELAQQLKNFTADCLTALGLQSGAAHTEIFVLANGELVFLEAAARTPGAVIVPLYEKQFSVNMIEAALQTEIGEPLPKVEDRSEWSYFSGIFPTAAGILKSKSALPIDSMYEMTWKVDEGETMTEAKSLRDISASVIARNESYDTLKRDFAKLTSYAPYELQP